MTPEQKDRIRAAARELGAALTDARDDFDVNVRQADITTFGDRHRRYAYALTVEATTREVIA